MPERPPAQDNIASRLTLLLLPPLRILTCCADLTVAKCRQIIAILQYFGAHTTSGLGKLQNLNCQLWPNLLQLLEVG